MNMLMSFLSTLTRVCLSTPTTLTEKLFARVIKGKRCIRARRKNMVLLGDKDILVADYPKYQPHSIVRMQIPRRYNPLFKNANVGQVLVIVARVLAQAPSRLFYIGLRDLKVNINGSIDVVFRHRSVVNTNI